MKYDKLVFTESGRPGFVLTIDFGGIGELTVKSSSSGEVNWRRLTAPVKDILNAKISACGFESWSSEATIVPCWGVDFFGKDGKLAKRISGCMTVPDQIRSLLEFCVSLAENRSKDTPNLFCSAL